MPKHYQVRDKYFTKAKKEGYRARSAFKLKEIQDQYKILKKGDVVLDLGAAPGSFLQFISKIVGPKGEVYGVDIQEIEGLSEQNIQTFVCDIFNADQMMVQLELLGIESFDVITSDLAPATSGIKDLDQAKSIELNMQALRIAEAYLKKRGNLVLKVFQGEDFKKLMDEAKKHFKKVSTFKPHSSRGRSREVYVIGLGKI